VRITHAFAPLLLESKGRVVNISSLNGIVASPMIGAYSMSKHASKRTAMRSVPSWRVLL
jgi:NAD(P)-dependent dehydrogenase (short-subunit alcohol dehydrogenase family)